MKKLIYTLILSSFLLVGCEDFVDEPQIGRLSADAAFTNEVDLELGLLGAYNHLDYTQAIKFSAVITDEVSLGFDNGGQDIDLFAFRLNSASGVSAAIWIRYYRALNAATRVIEAGNALTDITDQDLFDSVMGQAYALRAFAHFHLLSFYSEDITDDASAGVIILNFVPTTDQNLARSTTGEVFTVIDSDITAAEALLDATTSNSDVTYMGTDFLTAMKARMALYRGDLTTADTEAANILASYDIATRDEVQDVFDDNSNAGIVFKLERTINDDYDGQGTTANASAGGWAGACFAFVNATIDGSPYLEMSDGLFDILNADQTDIRFSVAVHETYDEGLGIVPIGKYSGSEGQPLMNDLKVFRAEEMLLIRAEVAAANGDFAGAATYVKTLRDARFDAAQTVDTYASAQAAYADILLERRKELCYEGHRWADLRRLGTSAGLAGVERVATDCAVNGACLLENGDIRLTSIPIPISELDANSAMVQTTGY